ncbi:MAG TPA: tripartite tricarboxylate transporter substrate binding protein [Burkholderiaceae bacterium]|nr:tripartite tricarboxylate transporter substrate binding protein [Burkholderiaceae bacterium]
MVSALRPNPLPPEAVRTGRRRWLIATGAACLPLGAAHAQGWQPTRPVRLIVPYPPGGAIDIIGRFIAPQLQSALSQSVFVENRGGAVGMIGSEIAYNAPPDGTTFVVASADTHSINPAVYGDIRYDARACAPAAAIAKVDYILVGKPSLPATTVREVMELGRRQELTYASSGVGSSAQVMTEALRLKYGLKMLHVPYGGSAPTAVAVMSEQVDVALLPITIALSNKAKLKIFGLVSNNRFAGEPTLQTLAEQGYPIDLDAAWVGLLAPPKTPREVLLRINEIVDQLVKQPDTQTRLYSLGMAPFTMGLDEFGSYLRTEYGRWGGIVRTAGIRADSTAPK